MLDAIFSPVFNAADVLAMICFPVALWYLIRPVKRKESDDARD